MATFGVLIHDTLANAAKLWCQEHILRYNLKWWAHLDLNQGPADYESDALTN
jgi:hypothetical protein